MILPEFNLYTLSGKGWKELGLDSLEHCHDKNHYLLYQFDVVYNYNSRGFRGNEWPESIDKLKEAIWCFGDSFTVGLGSPLAHTWPSILEQQLNRQCINASLNGASNFWIARKLLHILKYVKPEIIVVHWSFAHRVEEHNDSLSDEDRQVFADTRSTEIMILDFCELLTKIRLEQGKGDTKIIHSFIPEWSTVTSEEMRREKWNYFRGSSWPDCPTSLHELNSLNTKILSEVKKFNVLYETLVDSLSYYSILQKQLDQIVYIPEFVKLDLARDGFHYDIKTATNFANNIKELICQNEY
jgi:hypothetical protein